MAPSSAPTSTQTLYLPRSELALSLLQQHYVEPERLAGADLAAHAGTELERAAPELISERDGDWLTLRAGPRSLRVHCPRSGPAWGKQVCLERIAAAAQTLVPALRSDSLDRRIVASLLRPLDPHSRTSWMRAQDPCRYRSLEACTEPVSHVGLAFHRGTEGELRVLSVMPGSSAAQAGVHPGDRLLHISGLPARQLHPEEARWLLSGEKGSRVALAVAAQAGGEARALELQRSSTGSPPLTVRRFDDGIIYLRLWGFEDGDAARVRKVLRGQRPTGVIFDLRDNPGGLLNEAVQIADLFLDRGTIATVETPKRGRAGAVRATVSSTLRFFPLVVLINERSASASELVTGALVEGRRALVLGRRSYGKGSVQAPLPVVDGALWATIARYIVGDRRAVQRYGIAPDLELRTRIVDRHAPRLRHVPRARREADNAGALTARKRAERSRQAHVVSVLGDRGALLEPHRDGDVRVAWRVLGACATPRRAEALRCLEEVVPKIAASEARRIDRALADAGFSWKESETQPSREAQLRGELEIPMLVPSQRAQIALTLRSSEAAPLTGVVAELRSENALLDGLELALGTLRPGEATRAEHAIPVPEGWVPRRDPVTVHLTLPGGAQLSTPEPIAGIAELRRATPPPVQLTLRAQAGALRAGKPLRFCARLRHLGSGGDAPAPAYFVAPDPRLMPLEGLTPAFHRGPALAPGSEAEHCFEGRAPEELSEGSAQLLVRYGAWLGPLWGREDLELPTGKAAPGAAPPSSDVGARPEVHFEVQGDALLTQQARVTVTLSTKSRGVPAEAAAIYVGDEKLAGELAGPDGAVSLRAEVEVGRRSTQVDALVRDAKGRVIRRSLRVLRSTD